MKFVLRNLKVGESLKGCVEEMHPNGEILISFQGDLLRVQNQTGRRFHLGDSVQLIVKAVNPLRFQLLPDSEEMRRRGKIDVSV